MINPFIISDTRQQAVYRAYADKESWLIQCMTIGADGAALRAYDYRANQYAMTTPYPNQDVVAYLRMLARDALLRGEPLPATAEQAIEQERLHQIRDLAERFNLSALDRFRQS